MATKFFPVGCTTVTATTTSAATIIPSGGNYMRIVRVNNSSRVWIKFGTDTVTVTTSNGMELLPGMAEEFSNPNPSLYSYFAVITDTSTCGVNVCSSPTFSIP